MANNESTCSCGCGNEAHIIMRRQTIDGITLLLWSDGAITDAGYAYIVRGARNPTVIESRRRAGRKWLESARTYEFKTFLEAIRQDKIDGLSKTWFS